MTAVLPDGLDAEPSLAAALVRASEFPRLRYMGSKYRLTSELAGVMSRLGGETALDAFSGSGVVSYLFKALGYSVTSNDFLTFPAVIARATLTNSSARLTNDEVDRICSNNADGRDFIQRTFQGLYFNDADREFLDSAWSHIDCMTDPKRSVALAALVLASAKKQPRGVFTVTDLRYDDGRRDLRISMEQQFREAVAAYNRVVFDNGKSHRVRCGDVLTMRARPWDVVYLDPPYAPPADDNCYIKRYHFLEGLSVYWQNRPIMHHTKTKKLEKRYTPFSYKRTILEALDRTFELFAGSTIVLSYSSNSVPDAATIRGLLLDHKGHVEMQVVDHRYSFGTHAAAERRTAAEYLFVAT